MNEHERTRGVLLFATVDLLDIAEPYIVRSDRRNIKSQYDVLYLDGVADSVDVCKWALGPWSRSHS